LSLIVFGVALPWIVVALFVGLGAWIGFQLIHQNGRLLARLESLEQRLAQLTVMPASSPPTEPAPLPPSGLPIGSPAPEFELPDLDGVRRRLSEFRDRAVLLVFFNPRCGFCTQMAPDLAALPVDGVDGHPVPLVVSTGNRKENRQLVQESGLRCPVLRQREMEVAAQYQAHGTPMGYLIDAQGRIASELAVGAAGLLALAAGRAGGGGRNGHEASGNGHATLGGTRSLAESKIDRDGLPAGTRAPLFRLPRLEGGELSLAAYRGQRVLLVFSDPRCGPCDELAPRLEQAARQIHPLRGYPQVQVLMVSRRDEAANRAKVAEQGLTFPVVLQRQWEISREYGMFATPIGYLIDEQGVIAADVAVGVEPILALLSGVATVGGGVAGSGERLMQR
jgi:peroxiredoxin